MSRCLGIDYPDKACYAFDSYLHEELTFQSKYIRLLAWWVDYDRRVAGYLFLGNGADVVVSLTSVLEVNEWFSNSFCGFFLGKREAYSVVKKHSKNTWSNYGIVKTMMNSKVLFFFKFSSKDGLDAMLENVWVKFHDVPITAFTKDGLSAIATELGTPLMLDSYTSVMCIESWGRSSYVRAMLELRADAELKDSLVVAVPKIEDECPKKPVPVTTKNNKTTRQAVSGVQIGSNSQLVYKPKRTGMTPKKTKVMNATNDASLLTTMNYFEALSNMVDVDEERGTRTPSAQVAILPAVASKKINDVVFEEDNESEVEEVHNETANFMASKLFKVNEGFTGETGVGNSSLDEQ
ncbi:hypothetical protein Tco_1396598 [Tanacetum coccineum]